MGTKYWSSIIALVLMGATSLPDIGAQVRAARTGGSVAVQRTTTVHRGAAVLLAGRSSRAKKVTRRLVVAERPSKARKVSLRLVVMGRLLLVKRAMLQRVGTGAWWSATAMKTTKPGVRSPESARPSPLARCWRAHPRRLRPSSWGEPRTGLTRTFITLASTRAAPWHIRWSPGRCEA